MYSRSEQRKIWERWSLLMEADESQHSDSCGIPCVCVCPPAELVVAESVVVIKKLLQMQPEKHSDIIKHMAKLTDNIQVRFSFPSSHCEEEPGIIFRPLGCRCRWRGPASCG